MICLTHLVSKFTCSCYARYLPLSAARFSCLLLRFLRRFHSCYQSSSTSHSLCASPCFWLSSTSLLLTIQLNALDCSGLNWQKYSRLAFYFTDSRLFWRLGCLRLVVQFNTKKKSELPTYKSSKNIMNSLLRDITKIQLLKTSPNWQSSLT